MNQTVEMKKVAIFGNGGTGKTTIVNRLLGNKFDPRYCATLGVKVNPIHCHDVVLDIWDVAGQERFCGLIDGYFVNCDMGILVIDDTRLSITIGKTWLAKFKRICPDKPVLIVRNKSEISNDKHNAKFDISLSAKNTMTMAPLLKRIYEMLFPNRIVDDSMFE